MTEEIPLVERDHELRVLGQLFEETKNGRGAFVVIFGEAGIGKTRLVRELARLVGNESRLIEARCYRDVGALAYGPWITVLRQLASAAPLLHASRRTGTFMPELVKVAIEAGGSAQVLQLLRAETRDASALLSSMEHDKLRLFEAVAKPLVEAAKQKAIILFFDDLTWADNATVDLLAHVSPVLENQSILIVSAVRDTDLDPESPLAQYLVQEIRDRRVHEFHLKPLSEKATVTVVESVLGKAAVTPDLIPTIFARTGGNPFFVVELARAISSQFDVSELSRAIKISELRIPTSVKTVIYQRLARLKSETLQTLTSAAIVGREFTFEVLSGLTEASEDILLDQLEEALRTRILRERKIGQTEVFSFVDAQVHDYLVQEVSLIRRRRYHKKIADLIEGKYPALATSQPETLAFHYMQAGENDKALKYTLVAADNAQLVYAHKDAVKLYRQALELIEGNPLLVARVNERLSDSLHLSGHYEEARVNYESALSQISSEDRIWRSRLHRNIALTWTRQHRYDDALGALETAEATIGQPHTEPSPEWQQEWIQAKLDRVMVYYWQGNVGKMVELINEIKPMVEKEAKPFQRAEFFLCLVAAMLRRDRYVASDETVANALAAVAASKESGDGREICWATFWLGFSRLWRGDYAEAERDLTNTLQMAERYGDLIIQARCHTYLTILHRKRGLLEEAKLDALRALEVATAARMPEYIAMAKANLAWVEWRQKNLGEAESNARSAMEMLQKVPQGQIFAWTAAWPLVAVALSQEKLAEAVHHARSMLEATQQPLPEELNTAVKGAIGALEKGEQELARNRFRDAAGLAEDSGYL